MKMIKNIIEYLIAISVIPAIVLTVISVTELKDVRNVQYELLSEEDGVYNITPGTYRKLWENKRIKNYELESNYPLITKEEMDRVTWQVGEVKNEIYIDENGEKRIRINVGRIIFDGSDDEDWVYISNASHSGYIAMSIVIPNVINTNFINSYNAPVTNSWDVFRDATNIIVRLTTSGIFDIKLPVTKEAEFREYLSQNPLTVTYELVEKEDRPVEVYDFSKFRLTYDKNRGRLIFDIDDGYYQWEITNDDRLIPITGLYDLGNVWTVKFYVYKIQPLIRTLVLLIPLIVISGLLLYFYNLIKKKEYE